MTVPVPTITILFVQSTYCLAYRTSLSSGFRVFTGERSKDV